MVSLEILEVIRMSCGSDMDELRKLKISGTSIRWDVTGKCFYR